MASEVENPSTATAADEEHAVEVEGASSRSNAFLAGLLTMVFAIGLVWTMVAVLVVAVTDTPLIGAIGVGAYVAFFIGGGFGAIFTSASAFKGAH